MRHNKYANQIVETDGLTFHSKREARRWGELRLLERAGVISELRRQVCYELAVNGTHVCDYYADFVYVEQGREIVEDAKGVRTKEFILKAKLLRACLGIAIQEV